MVAIQRRIATQGGITMMLPIEDAEWVGAELTRRFGLDRWSFSLTAAVTGRPLGHPPYAGADGSLEGSLQQLLLPRQRG